MLFLHCKMFENILFFPTSRVSLFIVNLCIVIHCRRRPCKSTPTTLSGWSYNSCPVLDVILLSVLSKCYLAACPLLTVILLPVHSWLLSCCLSSPDCYLAACPLLTVILLPVLSWLLSCCLSSPACYLASCPLLTVIWLPVLS